MVAWMAVRHGRGMRPCEPVHPACPQSPLTACAQRALPILGGDVPSPGPRRDASYVQKFCVCHSPGVGASIERCGAPLLAVVLLVSADGASVECMSAQDMAAKNREFFGNPGFRENQRECINATLSGHDTFVLMPTGGAPSAFNLPCTCQLTHSIRLQIDGGTLTDTSCVSRVYRNDGVT